MRVFIIHIAVQLACIQNVNEFGMFIENRVLDLCFSLLNQFNVLHHDKKLF